MQCPIAKTLVFATLLSSVVHAASHLGPEAIAVSPDGRTVFAALETSGGVVAIDASTKNIASTWQLSGRTTGVTVAPDGTRFATTVNERGIGKIVRQDGTERVAGHGTMAPLVSPDGTALFVANRFDNSVATFSTRDLSPKQTFKVEREPVALAFGKDGKLLFVMNHLPNIRATEDEVAAAVSIIDTATGKVRSVALANGSTGGRGIAASPDGKRIYVAHTLGRFQLPATQLERGWMNTAALSILDGETGEYINTVLLDDPDLGAANPWSVAVSADGKTIAVSHAGSREVSLIDATALDTRLAKAAKGENATAVTKSADDVPNDLSFLVSIRRRIPLQEDGPRGIVFAQGSFWTAAYFVDAVDVVPADGSHVSTIALGPKPDLQKERVLRGEMLWNDATLCFQKWQSCASCHPDGRSDALNWDQINDGTGNPKQSKSMILSYCTPPAMVTGIRPDMETANRKGMRFIEFTERPEDDMKCIDEYLRALAPIPSPHLVDGKLSASAERGKVLFNGKAACAMCHAPAKGLYTDLRLHDIGLGTGREAGRAFDTPTLVECWRTAPYLYDGRALTIEEVISKHNPDDTHGVTQSLTEKERADLAEFVRSL